MAKLANKYEKMIEYEDKQFYRKLKAKKKAKNKPTPKKKKPKKNQEPKEKPFIPYKQQLLDERWKKKRKLVLEYKGYKCEKCGATKNLHIHHKRYLYGKYAWEYKMKDLLVLCANCHEKAHGIDLDKRMDELISRD